MAGKLKIHVDPDKCQGHSRCKSLAPELFELDEYGNAHEIGDGTVPDGLEDKAWLAKSNCPELAIDITEDCSRASHPGSPRRYIRFTRELIEPGRYP